MKTRWRILRTRHHDGETKTTVWLNHYAKEKDAQKEADQLNELKIRSPKRPKLVIQEDRHAVPVLEWNEPDTYTVESWEAPE